MSPKVDRKLPSTSSDQGAFAVGGHKTDNAAPKPVLFQFVDNNLTSKFVPQQLQQQQDRQQDRRQLRSFVKQRQLYLCVLWSDSTMTFHAI